MFETITSKIKTAKSKGLRWCLLCKGYSCLLLILQKIYGFHIWHAENPIYFRPYKQFVADLVNGYRPYSVVEVGCGLGDILCATDASRRYGIDTDQGAIRAAKMLHPLNGITWVVGDMSNLKDIQDHIDVLIAIGWVHAVSPEYLKSCIEPNINKLSYVIMDKFLNWGDPPFDHDFAFMNEISTCIGRHVPTEDAVREYWVFKMNGKVS